jgi:hypothetical protein
VLTTLLERGLADVLTVFIFVAIKLLGRSSEIVRLFRVTAPLKYGIFYAEEKE